MPGWGVRRRWQFFGGVRREFFQEPLELTDEGQRER